MTCPRCGRATAADGDLPARLGAAIDRWHQTGSAGVACAACVPLPAWDWSDDAFAFAHLGFEFWGWPTLSREFRARLTGFLDGHRTAFLTGRI